MRHRNAGRKLSRNSSHRTAMFRNMVTSLLIHGRIRTTEAKAKELRRIAERIITMGKHAPTSGLEGLDGEQLAAAQARRLHLLRRARVWIKDRSALSRVFGQYADLYRERNGGYTRILKLGVRPGDNADLALIELVDLDLAPSAPATSDEPVADASQADVSQTDTP